MSTLTGRLESTVAGGRAAELGLGESALATSHQQHSPRALQGLYGSVRNRTVTPAPAPLHLPRIRPGRIQLRFWIVLVAMLSVDAAAIWAVHELVVWVRRVCS